MAKWLGMKFTKLIALFIPVFVFTSNIASAVTFESSIESGLIKRYSISTDHFRIEFADLIKNQTDSDGDGISNIVETVAEAAENSWDLQVNELGFGAPVSGKLTIILDDNDEYLVSGAVGITSIGNDGDPYMAVDPWASSNVMKVTVAHEFFHTIQFGNYGTDFASSYQGISLAESTAVWVEDLVYDSIDDYVLYLPDFFDYPDYSVFSSLAPADTYFVYALNIWPRFLSEYLNDNRTIQDIWDNYYGSNMDDSNQYKVYDATKRAVESRGENLAEAFQDFTLWNLSPEDFYEEGESYPTPYIIDDTVEAEYTLIDDDYVPTLFGTNYLYFDNTNAESSFYFHVVKPENVSFAVTIVPENNGQIDLNKIESVIVSESDVMDTELAVDGIGSYDGVYAIVSPLEKDFDYNSGEDSVFEDGYSYYYMGSYGESMMEGSETVTPDDSESTDDNNDEDDSSSNENDILELEIASFDETSVSFVWNRISDDDIGSYKIYYGTASNDYSKSKSISTPYTTNTKISGLVAGETYYFQIEAFDENGEEIKAYASEEVSVTPSDWLFSDVSYSDSHYEAIADLVDRGIFEGYSDDTFRGDNEINRAELIKILIEGIGITPSSSEYRNCFKDVKTDWYAPYVCYAKKQNWIQGYSDGSFKPGNTVNKVEALKMLFKVYGEDLTEGTKVNSLPYNDLDRAAWYSIYVWKAVQLGILEESATSKFNPDALRTRGDMAYELYQYLVTKNL